MRSSIVVLPLILLSSMTTASLVRADQPDQNLVRLLTLGLKDQRDRLIRGIYRAHGRLVDDNLDTGHMEGAVKLFCSFDYQKGLLRFDRLEPCRAAVPMETDPPKDKSAWEIREVGGKFVRTPDLTLHAIQGSINPTVEIKKNTEPPYGQVKPLDVRSLCLASFNGIDTSFSAAYKGLTLKPPDRITKEGAHTYHIVFNFEMDYQYNFWFDEQQGYSPIRYELRERTGRNPDVWRTAATCEMSSERINDVWVPRSFVAEQTFQPSHRMRFEIAINWESVNKPVPDVLFTPDGLQMPAGALVINQQLGPPFIERVIGGGPVRAVMAPEKAEPSSPSSPYRRQLLLWILAGGLALLATSYFWRVFRQKRSAPNPGA